jgi:hypothetical protein
VIVEAPFALPVLNGKNITADPRAPSYGRCSTRRCTRPTAKDYRIILLDDRELRLVPRARGALHGWVRRLVIGFQNQECPRAAG